MDYVPRMIRSGKTSGGVWLLGTLLVLGLTVLSGCNKQKLIPNTKVADTPLHRQILRVVEKYRRAVIKRDAASILALVHPTYQDHSGTAKSDDDLDFDSLKKFLVQQYKNTTKIRMRIEYQKIKVKGLEAHVDTWIDATFVYQQPDGSPYYKRVADAQRFKLVKDNTTWRFISGL